MQIAAARNHIDCTLELGVKSPQIVFADADIEAVIPVVIGAIVQNASQTCSAGARVLVENNILAEFTKRLGTAFSELEIGTPEMDLNLGPLINQTQHRRITPYCEQAETDGVLMIASGRIADDSPKGDTSLLPDYTAPFLSITHSLMKKYLVQYCP